LVNQGNIMATLSNPVRAKSSTTPSSTGSGILDKFHELVVNTAGSGITWDANNRPFGEMDPGHFSTVPAQTANTVVLQNPISANDIYNVLLSETNRYTNQRLLRAVLVVDGGGGNTGSRPFAGVVYDGTAKAYLHPNYRQTVTSPPNPLAAGQEASAAPINQLISNLQASYNAAANNVQYIQTNVCHASCHNSCHSSRGRR
jgi:hypothetical protein